MFRMFHVNPAAEESQRLNQVTSVIESFIQNIRTISNKELDIPTSLAIQKWFQSKTREEKFQIVDNFLRAHYKDLY